MLGLNALLAPGNLVVTPKHPEWGQGQVQSVIDNHITVNFENSGKLTIDGRFVELELVDESR
ncbi:MAG: DUF3553 domain-containing protein [Rhodobacteraceae bacterium]|nr:DUF3553 domain-containing protein [Paracoccaceae bacterium]MCY4197839.1 DUF3553 domain-containing protein [Paracoccaceae bacterium]